MKQTMKQAIGCSRRCAEAYMYDTSCVATGSHMEGHGKTLLRERRTMPIDSTKSRLDGRMQRFTSHKTCAAGYKSAVVCRRTDWALSE